MANAKKPAKATKNPDDHLLAKYEHHTEMARKHRAHADLIEAKLGVQGKRIAHHYGDSPSPASPISKVKRRIVKDS